jgi:hypothetical protein
VNGIAIYNSNLTLLGLYGEPVSMVMIDHDSLSRTYRSVDGSAYEVVYRPNDLGKPYIIVARLNSESVAREILAHVKQTDPYYVSAFGFRHNSTDDFTGPLAAGADLIPAFQPDGRRRQPGRSENQGLPL